MTFSVKNDLLYKDGVQVRHHTTKKTSGKMKNPPKYIVIHYTAGTSFESDIKTLSSSSAQASCQLVMDKDGTVAQIGDFRDVLWHAGKSTWDGLSFLNSYSIGIEVTNPGYVDFHHEEDGVKYYNYPGAEKVVKWNDRDDVIISTRHRNGGPVKNWVQFSAEQIEALYDLVAALQAAYPIKEVVGHDMIAPDRKIDPGPCLPDDFYDNVNGGSGAPDIEDEVVVDEPKAEEDGITVTTANVNFRVDKSTSAGIIRVLPAGTRVTVHSEWKGWADVTVDGKRGFVSSQYLKRA